MSAPDILRFDPTLGWKEIIATAAAAFSLGAAVIALLKLHTFKEIGQFKD